ncbi:MAG: MlaD family protein [Pseudomonadota bacterium]|nr:MlaD family protein [Pseudomonadota bacterium]
METRASHILIGSAVLLFTLAFLGFAIWLSRVDVNREVKLYDIYFRGSVAGLAVGGDVRYRGIRIGAVEAIRIDPADPGQVQVTVELDSTTPIREGDVASLKLQGITGVAYVNVEGAVARSPRLTVPPGHELPVIPSVPSDLERLFAGAPELVGRAILVAERLADLLGEQNQTQIAGILTDLKTVTGTLAEQQDRIASTLVELERSAKSVSAVAAKAEGLVDDTSETMALARGAIVGFDNLVNHDATALIDELRATNRDLAIIAATASGVMQQSEESLVGFTQDGLGEVQRFVTEARLLVASLSRLAERIESGGAQSLLGRGGAEVNAE